MCINTYHYVDFDGGGLYFEQQKKGFICPQCSAPRKRYAKKVGDQWGNRKLVDINHIVFETNHYYRCYS